MCRELEYDEELINTDYVVREGLRHKALCDGQIWEQFYNVLKIGRSKSIVKYKRSCDCCDWVVFEVRKE